MAEKPPPAIDEISPEDLQAIFAELDAQTDRGAAILAAAIIDQLLTDILASRLITTTRMQERIFSTDRKGIASEYGSKVDLAFCTGLLTQEIFDDLRLIATIRNKFAHIGHPLDFNDPNISQWCKTLRSAAGAKPQPRSHFLLAFTRIATALITLKQIANLKINHLSNDPELRAAALKIIADSGLAT